MHKLKLLQLKYVNVRGYYKSFPDLRWLCWHGCHFRTVPSGLLKSSFLVAIDMTCGNLETFEPPVVLNSLKILTLDSCAKLACIFKLNLLPNLETLTLWSCYSLTHVCKTIQDLEKLALLNLTGCNKLWKKSANKKLKSLCVGGGILEEPLFSLPRSVMFLNLNFCNLMYDNDLRVLFNGPLYGLSLSGNLYESIPNNIDLRMIQVLNLKFCYNLKSIPCLPSTIEVLYTAECKSLEKVTFQSTCFRLKKFDCRDCFKLSEVEGLFKLVAIEEIDEADLGHMRWIKAYQDHRLNLVCNWNTYGRIQQIQMLYEYGIRSTYLQGIKDQSMLTNEYASSSGFLSLCVSMHPKKHNIRGLNISCLYRLSGSMDKDDWCLFIKISNITKGVTWFYNPMVYCKPRVDEDAIWLSYWPIGNVLEVGDEVNVSMHVEEGMTVNETAASLVYVDDDDIQREENWENNTLMMEDMTGGDLSEFEVRPGVYYLSRRDFFKWSTPEVIKSWVGESNPCTELQGWGKSYRSWDSNESCMSLNYVPELHSDTLYKRIWVGYFDKVIDISNIKKAVSGLEGVDFVWPIKSHVYTDKKSLFVLGSVDSMTVETCVMEFEKTVRIIDIDYNVDPYFKLYFKKIRGKISEGLHSRIVKFVTSGSRQFLAEGNT